ncbi:hypothetical protein [Neorhodopirellula pilleata]|uniref:hypothetical protein n=1 Tax=Neorhodopirellula pilleata TaxID=2714738 RepID=UPI0011B78CD7|nr:hypothetical protein [Neorhodopirellula pilleata]
MVITTFPIKTLRTTTPTDWAESILYAGGGYNEPMNRNPYETPPEVDDATADDRRETRRPILAVAATMTFGALGVGAVMFGDLLGAGLAWVVAIGFACITETK